MFSYYGGAPEAVSERTGSASEKFRVRCGVLIEKQGFSFKQRPVLLYCSENWEATKGKDMHYHTITAHLMFQELLANDKSVIFTEKAAVTSNSYI